jgi:hypothetical protein
MVEKTIIKFAIKEHNIKIDKITPDIEALVRYARGIGFSEGYKEGKSFQRKKHLELMTQISQEFKKSIVSVPTKRRI